ncbi:hypothetical protein RRF57_008713 [Xylaria bambusicola]|uniref:Peptidase C14 caspase domain-containing protein n=1 Tax=Xylaria bambusicola TaxID=326684 RepID=A0AAN7UYH0_9PEZI
MTESVSPKRFALLVGIDLYPHNGTRRSQKGTPLSVNNLHGCVNDVEGVEKLLAAKFPLLAPVVLTSSLSSASSLVPMEPEDRQPTFANIKKEIFNIYENARTGDQFFFYFSGHGAQLSRTAQSPARRPTDPSLLPADYFCGQPAVRGWQLNKWLKKFNEKGIQIVIILDSCHAGGAWRHDISYRSPDSWYPPPNLPTDEVAAEEDSKINGRDGSLEDSWDLNPQYFTLMAACKPDQLAEEKKINGVTNGVFTYALLDHLQSKSGVSLPTYRNIRDYITYTIQQHSGQHPQVFGRDRLTFLGNKEVFSAVPISAKMNGAIIVLPVGRIHGVKKGAEFVAQFPHSGIVFPINKVDEYTSEANKPPQFSGTLPSRLTVLPYRWLSEKTFTVLVDPSLHRSFQEHLYKGLQRRIIGSIEVVEYMEGDEDRWPNSTEWKLRKRGGTTIDIFGPSSLVGYDGPIRGLDTEGETDELQATKLAGALAHLFRFGQILHLRTDASRDTPPFKVALHAGAINTDHTVFADGKTYTYEFNNATQEDLYLTVIILGPGFNIKQLFPSQDISEMISGRGIRRFAFTLNIPVKLKGDKSEDSQRHPYRDVIRTIVTTGKALSFKSLELPRVWDTDQMDHQHRSDLGRNAHLLQDFRWWIRDNSILSACKDNPLRQ